jgi:Predicted soluble lytic transglycosylase fused to an ABC-type amino acid-binding protein
MFRSLLRFWRIVVPVVVILVGGLVLLASWYDPGSIIRGKTATSAPPPPWSEGGVLRVGSPEPVRQASVLSPYGPGFEFELVSRFCLEAAATPEWVVVADKTSGIAMLQRNEIDLLVGFWGNDTHPPGEQDAPDTAIPIAKGKAYAHFNPVRISGATAPSPDTAEENAQVPPPPPPSLLSRVFTAIFPAFAKASAPLVQPKTEQPFPVFSLATEGQEKGEDIVLLDPASYALWLPFMGDVRSKRVGQKMPYRWFWRNDASPLAARLDDFWKSPSRTDELAELTERYFGFLPRTLRQGDILDLAEALSTRLPKYETSIMNASRETGVPPLLLVAIIYQESRFDPDAVSETRVRGIMQLTSATADMLGVDRNDPEECIMGGARYLRDLRDRVSKKTDNDWDRWFMALAAYNQGMTNLNRTIRLAQEMGRKGDSWTDLKYAFPFSTTCRGVEAKYFVERVRYYNFILHGLVALAPAETQNLAPLLGLAVAGSDL